MTKKTMLLMMSTALKVMPVATRSMLAVRMTIVMRTTIVTRTRIKLTLMAMRTLIGRAMLVAMTTECLMLEVEWLHPELARSVGIVFCSTAPIGHPGFQNQIPTTTGRWTGPLLSANTIGVTTKPYPHL
jgi:hypothetical protein